MTRRVAGLALVLALAACAEDGRVGDGEGTIGGRPRSRFYIERDKFRAADDPASVPAAAADFLRPDDEVFGVVVDGSARAYPITMVAYHHVVNDRVGKKPVAITY